MIQEHYIAQINHLMHKELLYKINIKEVQEVVIQIIHYQDHLIDKVVKVEIIDTIQIRLQMFQHLLQVHQVLMLDQEVVQDLIVKI